jgi:hypothetical protein
MRGYVEEIYACCETDPDGASERLSTRKLSSPSVSNY